MVRTDRTKIFPAISVALLVSLTLLFFGPLYIYFNNIQEFGDLFKDIWYFLLVFSLISTLFISIILLLLDGKIHKVAVLLLFAFGCLLWVQGNIMVWNYGVFDGKEIPWNKYAVYGIIDTTIWLGILILSIIKREFIYKLVARISMCLIIIQLIALATVAYQSSKYEIPTKYGLSEEHKFDFSKGRNVLVIVLDTFQSDIFQELLNENKDYERVFSGFTYFRNSLGGYPTTYASIPLILTGKYYDNSVPIQDFIFKNFSKYSLPYALKQNGFQVELYTNDKQTIFFDQRIASNYAPISNTNKKETVIKLYDLAFFRYSPHYIKRYIYEITKERIVLGDKNHSDLYFARRVVTDTRVNNSNDIFKFIHLRGVHPPFQLNEKLEYQDLPGNRDGYKIQAKSAIEITKRLLNTLKSKGIYDNSMIVIVGDHGIGSYGVNIEASGYKETTTVPKYASEKIVGSGIPLILIKPFGSNGDMVISDAPVSLSDIPKTILSELNLKNNFPGRSMFGIKNTENRERRFFMYNWTHDYWNKEYLPTMEEYIISGFSWLTESWKPTYRKYTAQGIKNDQPTVYKYGTQLTFGKGGNAQQYQGDGWSEPEKGFTWTDGKSASLIIPVARPNSDLTLTAMISPFRGKQEVNIYLKGKKLTNWIVNKKAEYKVTIPNELIKGSSWLELCFELPDCASPYDLKISSDRRMLGLAFESVIIFENKK